MFGTATYGAGAMRETVVGGYGGAATYAASPMMGTTAYAQPAMQYAAPATTAYAQPAVQYAAPAAQYSAPVTTMAAPSYVAAPTQVASYVAPPVQQMYAAPQQMYAPQPMYAPQQMVAPQMAMPAEPPRLTVGIPTPEQIAQQKAAYAAALDKQLEQAKATVIQETKIEQQMVKFNADKNVSMYSMQVEEKRTEAEALVEEQATIQALELKKALVERNLQLDNQASGMTMDYRMKELMTQCAVKQYQFQEQYVKAENALAQDYNAQVAKSMTGTAYAPTAAAVR